MGYLTDLTETTDPTSGDYLLIADASAAASDRDRRVDVGKFCLLAGTGSFTATRTFAPTATNVNAFNVNMPASTSAVAVNFQYNSINYIAVNVSASTALLSFGNPDLGNNVAGPAFRLGRNANAGAEGPTAGHFRWTAADATSRYSWLDAAFKVRIHTAAPTGSSGSPTVTDTAGSVLGDQTSWHTAKKVGKQVKDTTTALRRVLDLKVHEFTYKENSYHDAAGQDQVFTGLVGYKRDDWFLKNCGRDQVPALNEISVIGHLVLAIQALDQKVKALEGV